MEADALINKTKTGWNSVSRCYFEMSEWEIASLNTVEWREERIQGHFVCYSYQRRTDHKVDDCYWMVQAVIEITGHILPCTNQFITLQNGACCRSYFNLIEAMDMISIRTWIYTLSSNCLAKWNSYWFFWCSFIWKKNILTLTQQYSRQYILSLTNENSYFHMSKYKNIFKM